MISNDLNRSLPAIFSELVFGAPTGGAYVLNQGDRGLLASLDALSAPAASAANKGGGTIAAHVAHLQYGLSLMNRWADGEANPFADADWTAAWKRATVSDAEWKELREGFRAEVTKWHAALGKPREVAGMEMDGVLGSVVHLGYHFGAMRQIDPTLRGPKASE